MEEFINDLDNNGNRLLVALARDDLTHDELEYMRDYTPDYHQRENIIKILKYAIEENNERIENDILKMCVNVSFMDEICKTNVYDNYSIFFEKFYQIDVSEFIEDEVKKHIIMIYMMYLLNRSELTIDDIKRVFLNGNFHLFLSMDELDSSKYPDPSDNFFIIRDSVINSLRGSLFNTNIKIPVSLYLFFDEINVTYDVWMCLLNSIKTNNEDSKKFLLEKVWENNIDYYDIVELNSIELLIEMKKRGIEIDHKKLFRFALFKNCVDITEFVLNNVSELDGFNMIDEISDFYINQIKTIDLYCKFGYPLEKIWPRIVNEAEEINIEEFKIFITYFYHKEGYLAPFLVKMIIFCLHSTNMFVYLENMGLLYHILNDDLLKELRDKDDYYFIATLDLKGYNIECVRDNDIMNNKGYIGLKNRIRMSLESC